MSQSAWGRHPTQSPDPSIYRWFPNMGEANRVIGERLVQGVTLQEDSSVVFPPLPWGWIFTRERQLILAHPHQPPPPGVGGGGGLIRGLPLEGPTFGNTHNPLPPQPHASNPWDAVLPPVSAITPLHSPPGGVPIVHPHSASKLGSVSSLSSKQTTPWSSSDGSRGSLSMQVHFQLRMQAAKKFQYCILGHLASVPS